VISVVEALVIIQYSVLIVRICSGIRGSMYKVMKTFVCRGTGCTSVDIGVNAKLDKFCYLGDMLGVEYCRWRC